MLYRGIYHDGLVRLDSPADIPNGSVVQVHLKRAVDGRIKQGSQSKRAAPKTRGASSSSPRKAGSKPKKGTSKTDLPGFGMWRDRWPSDRSSADIARELREQVSRRKR